ncbi:flagella assembly protein FlgT middle domain-containing protein [Marinagarivorans algicola]|uniref:flagella assembly protein FlgT middle domain-containing protein n=1 Tax=Marinagarivorans algicola TaxID=1513270 RepID=UPI0037352ADD
MNNDDFIILKAIVLVIGLSHLLGCGVAPKQSSVEAFMDDDYAIDTQEPSKLDARHHDGFSRREPEAIARADSVLIDEAVISDSATDHALPSITGDGAHPASVSLNSHKADTPRCLADAHPSFSYRKRVGVLPMILQHRQDAVDIPYVEREYAQALVRRLDQADQLIPLDASNYHSLNIYSRQSRMHSPMSTELVRRTAKDLNVQFLVAGRLLDLSFDRTQTHAIDLVTSLQSWKRLGRQIYQRGTDSYWRQMHLELSIFDGPSGLLLKRQRYNAAANHVINGQRTHRSRRSGLGEVGLDTGYFWQSDYGQLMSRTLDEQATLINRTVECLPLRAQVSRVNGEMIEIDVGIDSRIMPGDRLRVFHKEPAGLDTQGMPSYRWQYYGAITIMGVFPLSSVAQLDKDLPIGIVSVGDIIQAW